MLAEYLYVFETSDEDEHETHCELQHQTIAEIDEARNTGSFKEEAGEGTQNAQGEVSIENQDECEYQLNDCYCDNGYHSVESSDDDEEWEADVEYEVEGKVGGSQSLNKEEASLYVGTGVNKEHICTRVNKVKNMPTTS